MNSEFMVENIQGLRLVGCANFRVSKLKFETHVRSFDRSFERRINK